MDKDNIYTPQMLAERFQVTIFAPYECDLRNPVSIRGRKSYKHTEIVAVRVSENKSFGFAITLTIFADGHYRKLQWEMLSNEEKLRVQKELGV